MKKLICLILALLMLCASLIACKRETAPEAGETDESTTEATVTDIDLSEYKVIYPMSFKQEERSAVSGMIGKFKTAYGTKLESGSDFLAVAQQTDIVTEDKEILIGKTNRKESGEAANALKSGEYTVYVTENKVIVYGGNSDTLARAIESFSETVLANGKLAIASDYSKTVNIVSELYGEGTPMHTVSTQYKIEFPQENTKYEQVNANAFKDKIEVQTGKVLNVGVSASPEGKVIYIGAEDSTLDYYDYKISVSSESIILSGGSGTAIGWAVERLAKMLMDGSFKIEDGSTVDGKFDKKYFNPIAENISLFTPKWASEFDTSAYSWLFDFDEKTYAVTCPDGRVTTKVHRGDGKYYKENTLEAVASSILAGADSVEVDVRLTKDNVAVLLHNEDIDSVNMSEYLGKEGYPKSTKIYDWTYEQIQVLEYGNGEKIPTLYEALRLCRGRVFVQVDDKAEAFKNTHNDLYYIAKATDSMECFFHHYGVGTLETWSAKAGDAELTAYVAKCKSYLAESGHALRKVYWPNESPNRGTYTGYPLNETNSEWDEMISEGRKMFWTEDPVKLIKYLVVTKGQTATK